MTDLRSKIGAMVYRAKVYPGQPSSESNGVAQRIIRAMASHIECRWGMPILAVRLLREHGLEAQAEEMARRNRKRVVVGT